MIVYYVCFIFIYVKDKIKGKGIFKKLLVVRFIQIFSLEVVQVWYFVIFVQILDYNFVCMCYNDYFLKRCSILVL